MKIELDKKSKQRILTAYKFRDSLYPSNVWGFDIETSQNNKRIDLIVVTNGKETFPFRDVQEFKTFIHTSPKMSRARLYATNLAFDFFAVFHDDPYQVIRERNNILYGTTIFQERKHNGKHLKVHFLDTMRIYPAPVEALGKLIRCPKLAYPFKKKDGTTDFRRPRNKKEWEQLIEYCTRDALISVKFMTDIVFAYCKENQVPYKNTAASWSLAHFLSKYFHDKWYVHDHETNMKLFEAYYGGRTETFARGVAYDVAHYDVNSLYPSVMLKEYPHPNSLTYRKYGYEKLIQQYEGVSYIEGIMPPMMYPPLPVHKDGKLIFPCGLIKGRYSHVELRRAIQMGFRIQNIGETHYYKYMCTPFREYILARYDSRMKYKEQKSPLEAVEKLKMNSLYGRFGFRYFESDAIISSQDFEEHKDEILYDYVEKKGDNYYRVRYQSDEPPSYSFPIIALYVTAYARLRLLDLLLQTNGKALYCDTDSIFVEKKYDTFVESPLLGDVKCESITPQGNTYKKMMVVKAKVYCAYGKKPKVKGVRGYFKDYDEFETHMRKQSVKPTPIKQERIARFRSVISSKKHHKRGELYHNQPYEDSKVLSLEDDKRVWDEPKFDPDRLVWSHPRMLTEYDYSKEKR